jgi:ribonuclease HI
MAPTNGSVRGDCTLLQFADDIALYYSDKDPGTITTKLAEGIHDLNAFLTESGLELAPDKCQFCLFSKNRKVRTTPWHIPIGNAVSKSVQVIKFLGLSFDSSLSWDRHLDFIRTKCIKPLSIISYLRSTWIGADPTTLLGLYVALVRSRIEYGSHLFSPMNNTQATFLERIQCKAIKLAMGYMKSTPTNIIHAESQIPPLTMRFKFLGRNYISRLLTFSNHPALDRISQLSNRRNHPTWIHTGKEPLFLTCYKEVEPMHHLIAHSDKPLMYSHPYRTLFQQVRVSFIEGQTARSSAQGNTMINSLVKDLENSNRCLFTDGSKTEGCPFVGLASVASTEPAAKLFRTSGYASIFTAEAMAIIETLELIKLSPYKYYSIFSDSRSVLGNLCSSPLPKQLNHLTLLIKERLLILEEEGKVVQFYWIPAHMGITHNERADTAAKESIYTGTDSQILLPWTDLRAHWKRTMVKEFRAWCLSFIGNTQRQILLRPLLFRLIVPLVYQMQASPETHRHAQQTSGWALLP